MQPANAVNSSPGIPGGAGSVTRSETTPKSKMRAETSAAMSRPAISMCSVPMMAVSGGFRI
jgi:hypothetical protein